MSPLCQDDVPLRQQLMALKQRSHQALSALDEACNALQNLEAQLESFLSDYYDQVGGYFEELERIERKLAAVKPDATVHTVTASVDFDSITERRYSQAIDREMKSLYRAMAKEYHPDAMRGRDAVAQLKDDVIKTINAAYARRNLGELWRIKWELEQRQAQPTRDKPETLARLHQHYDKMQQALQDVQTRQKQLEQSPAYALMQRAFQLRLCGKDFIELVTQHVRAQIEIKQRELVTTKIKQRCLQQLPDICYREAMA